MGGGGSTGGGESMGQGTEEPEGRFGEFPASVHRAGERGRPMEGRKSFHPIGGLERSHSSFHLSSLCGNPTMTQLHSIATMEPPT